MKQTVWKQIESLRQLKKEYKSSLRFHTFNINNLSQFGNKKLDIRDGKITCCIIRNPLLGDSNRCVGFSFCSPNDSYWKELGQFIALNRCTSKPINVAKEQLRTAIIHEAERLGVYWMDNIREEDLV